MDRYEAAIVFSLMLLTAVACLGLGSYLGERRTGRVWQQATVEQGVAEYNSVTGEWQWKEVGQ